MNPEFQLNCLSAKLRIAWYGTFLLFDRFELILSMLFFTDDGHFQYRIQFFSFNFHNILDSVDYWKLNKSYFEAI